MHREPVDSCQGRGIEQRRRKNEKLMDSDDSVVIAGGRGGGRWKRILEGSVVMDGDVTWADEHTMW